VEWTLEAQWLPSLPRGNAQHRRCQRTLLTPAHLRASAVC
jgi:hypothetical protein